MSLGLLKSFDGTALKSYCSSLKRLGRVACQRSVYYQSIFVINKQLGWKVASDSVTGGSYTVRDLRPDTTYFFLVRSRTSNRHGLASRLSAPVTTGNNNNNNNNN